MALVRGLEQRSALTIGKKTPKAPDPVATANAQATANAEAVRESAKVNQIGTTGPWGRTYFTGDIGTPDRRQVTELSQAGQQIHNNEADIGQALTGRGRGLAVQIQGQQPFSLEGAPAGGQSQRVNFNAPSHGQNPFQFGIDDINSASSISREGLPTAPWEQDRDAHIAAVEQATYDRSFNQMRPEIDRQRSELETRLANQGIALDSDTYKREIDRFERGVHNQLNDLSLGSVAAGRQEDSRLYNQGLAGRGQAFGEETTAKQFDQSEAQRLLQTRLGKGAFDQSEAQRLFGQALAEADFARGEDQRMFGNQNTTRDRAIQESLLERTQPMNELAAILQGSPALQGPPGANPGQYQVQPADVMGSTYANYQNQLNSANASRQGLFGLLGTAAGIAGATYGGPGWTFSDRRLKSNIRRIGRLPNGLGVYAYTKFGRHEVGLLAEEVREVNPAAVLSVGGRYMVNYAEAVR